MNLLTFWFLSSAILNSDVSNHHCLVRTAKLSFLCTQIACICVCVCIDIRGIIKRIGSDHKAESNLKGKLFYGFSVVILVRNVMTKVLRESFTSRKRMASMYLAGFAKERYCVDNFFFFLSGKRSIFRVLYTIDLARLQRLITLAFKNVRAYRKPHLSATNDLTAERHFHCFHGTGQTDETK